MYLCESVAAATNALSVILTPWNTSYLSFRPRRMEMVSSTVGSSTITGWKRRSSAASFSIYWRYSSSVVAPIQCSSPLRKHRLQHVVRHPWRRLSYRHRRSVCSSSINRMICPSLFLTSSRTAFRRSSNSPRYLAPATSAPISSAKIFLSLKTFRHIPCHDTLCQTLDGCGLTNTRLTDQNRVVFRLTGKDTDNITDLRITSDHRIQLLVSCLLHQILTVFIQGIISCLRIVT